MSIRHLSALFFLPLFTAAAAGPEMPQAVIPFQTGTAPIIDGRFSPEEWSQAAVIRQIRPLGSPTAAAVATEFHLMFDDEALYVAARCFDGTPGYPEAYQRPWHDLFFNNDDAIQVVLGVADPEIAVRDKINVGGYEGALDGEVAAADFYYLFTVNAVNARQRQFNEAPLEVAGFDSAVSVQPGEGWTVELRIPFVACGLEAVAGRTIYGNLFRFRPPDMLGWHLPSYGGYAAMPFGRFVFGGDATRERFPPPRRQTLPAATCRAAIKYGPLNGVVVGSVKITGKQPELSARLEVSGCVPVEGVLQFFPAVDRDRNLLEERQALLVCPLPPGDQPERQAHFTVRDPAGKPVAEVTTVCPAMTMPEWLGTDAGAEYIDQKIPAPWTLPELVDNHLKLLHQSLEFAPNALPSAVRRNGARDALLGGPARLLISRRGTTLKLSGPPAQLALDGTQARVAGSLHADDGTAIEARAKVDFDGFIEYKFELTTPELADIDQVTVIIPLADGVAKYLLPGVSVQKAGALTGAGYRGPASTLWVGNEEEGLSFNYDTDPFRSRDIRHQLELRQTADGDELIVRLVDGAGQLQGRSALFRFFLQPTPTKPYPNRPVRSAATWWWEGWSRWHGYPDLGRTEALKTRVAELAEQNRLLTLYCCQGLQEDAPAMTEFRDDLELEPQWRYYFWQDKDCYATCKRGPEGDLQLHNYRQLIAETGIRGIMSDGLSVPWGDANVLHPYGCGRPTVAALEADTPSLVVKQREFLKRLRGLFDATGDEFWLIAHTGGGIDVNTLSFFDAYFEGEQLMRFRRGYYPSRAMFAVGYSGLPWGWRTIYWPKQLHNYDGLDTALVYALLFNSEYAVNTDTEPEELDLQLLTRFGGPDREFHPFWRPQTRLGFNSETCLVSLYYSERESLVVVGNLRYRPGEYQLDLSKLYPGRVIEVADYLRREPVDGSRLHDELAPHSCRLLVVKPAGSEPEFPPSPEEITEEPAWTVTRFDAAQWQLTNAAPESKLTANELVLAASPATGAAVATFEPQFGRNLYVEMQVKLPDRFAFQLGKLTLTYGGGFPGWGWMATGPADPYGRGWIFQSIPLNRNEFKQLVINLHDGVLDVRYDGMTVIKRLSFELPPAGNRFVVRTWHDDVVRGRLVELSTRSRRPAPPAILHPVNSVPERQP
ncbi:glycoside hydrolase domain-containing protein [Victivallis sp. Marseille-Q1083]|uniref:glycoside hydrolase domain-containing protein n=1 Tax=Victivallis sp. Marseille-Q1083 TaxID=2717288 RepID=UPI00158E0D69|nr:glycoside hydrolase domain-containing protein [Victivallis sp. Marseille-Q1083]